MSYFAKLDDQGIVLNTSLGNENWDSTGWLEYTDQNPAVIGGDYVDGYFYEIQPYKSWTRDKGIWLAPTPKPNDGKFYRWNETALTWDLVNV